MVLGPDVVSGIIMEMFPTEIAYGIIIVGFGIFFLYFFGTDEWKGFSDLEKIIYSIITGWLLWFIVIYPISIGYETLNLYFTYTDYTDIFNKTIGNFYVFAGLIFSYFFIGRLLSDSPLFKNTFFVKFTSYLILFIIIILYPLLIFLYFSFKPTPYGFFAEELGKRIFIIIILLANLLIIFLKVNGILNLDALKNVYLKFNSMKHIVEKLKPINLFFIVILVVVIFILGPYLTGYMFFNPSVDDKNFKVGHLEIKYLPIENNSYGNLSGSLVIEKQVEVNFGWIKWVYIPQNFTIEKAYNTENKSKKYELSGNGVVIRGNGKANITIKGTQEINVDQNFYNFTIEYFDDTQIWNISFINPYQYDIKIKELVIRNSKDLKLIEWTNNDYVYLDWTNFNENINKSSSELTSGITIPPDNSKKTISLYFTKE